MKQCSESSLLIRWGNDYQSLTTNYLRISLPNYEGLQRFCETSKQLER
jgi:hypothetical protein